MFPHTSEITILRQKQLRAVVGLAPSTVWDRINPNSPRYDPTFPKPVRLGTRSVGWLSSEIQDWLAARVLASRVR